MCGIAGASGKDSETSVKKMLETIKHRGPDGSGTYSSGDITLGSVMLRITGEKLQPIHNSSALSYNGEIYNFREIAEKLQITTDSDSEVLFCLIGSTGLEAAISELDGDYAFTYMSGGTLHLARDTAGVKPLHYGNRGETFAFASEKKALSAIGIKDIFTLKPGHVLSFKGGELAEKRITGFAYGERINDERTASKSLLSAITQAVKKRNYKPCAIAFSGGIDSSLIAALCDDPVLYSVGMAGSHDIKQTRKAAKMLDLEDRLHLIELTMDDVESTIPYVIRAVGSTDPLQIGIAMPLFFASKAAHNDGIRVMLSGQGADELFAGYKRYESMSIKGLEKALEEDLASIAENNLERDDAVTMANSVELRVPYLDKYVVELALRITPELKIHNGHRKYILRMAAREILPDELVWKEKKAAQYSSGIYSAMEKIAKKNGYRGKGVGSTLKKYLEELKKE